MTAVGQGLDTVLREHPFFSELSPHHLEFLAGCGKNERFEKGEFLFRENGQADTFFIIRHGTVRIELYSTRRGPIMLETVGAGNVLGWSWLVPPYRWRFDARALELTRVVSMDGACLRKKCEDDPTLGYELLRRFALVLAERLEATRFQLLDLYGDPAERSEERQRDE